MRARAYWVVVAVVAALAVAVVALASTAGAEESGKKALRIGWAQDPQTMNPFVGQDAEDFSVWGLNWDLPLNFSPKDNGPIPGIAKSSKVTDGGKTTTFDLYPDLKWSDGEPITADDVVYSLKVLGGNGLLFTSYTTNVTSIAAPDPQTVVVKTSKPDARIVGGLFIYVLPKHVWGKVPVKKLLGSYKPDLPLVGSGPWIVTEFERGKILTLERNKNFRGEKPAFDKVQFIKYGNQDAVQRALKLGEVDINYEVDPASFKKIADGGDLTPVKGVSPSFTELAFNLCNKQDCPNAKFNPAVQDRAVRQALGYAIDRSRINKIAAQNTSFVAYGLLPPFYKEWFQKPKLDYPFDVAKANQLLDAAGYKKGSDGIRSKGDVKLSFDVYVRSESQYNIQAARLVKEMAEKVGVDFKVQVVSVDKLTELTTRQEGGKPAPDFDTFIWGWGGDPYDPSFLLSLLTTDQIGDSSDSFYSNPEYDKLYEEQISELDKAKRKQIINQMVEISQEDLPYLVLTIDPMLQAYQSGAVSDLKPSYPEPNGDIGTSYGYATFLNATPGGGDEGGGTSPVVWVLVGIAVLAVLALVVRMMRRRGGGGGKRESAELEV